MIKVCIIQPPYSTDYMRSDKLFEQCTPDMVLIVMPEYCDIPFLANTTQS